MINLEELKLYLLVKIYGSDYINGIQLHGEFLCYLTKLKTLTFSIQAIFYRAVPGINPLSKEEIERSFIGTKYKQIAPCININLNWCGAKCHMYSVPYTFEYLFDVCNSFPGGMFHTVRYLTMRDVYPFEHQFFQLISQDLPFLEILHIHNDKPQKQKQLSSITPITYFHLKVLNLRCAHVDYAEQFLLEKITHLPCLLNLNMKYESLTMITNNFTIDRTCFNFSKIKDLYLDKSFPSGSFYQYFPAL
jgi:hypothetical protein